MSYQDEQASLAAHQMREERQRREAAQNHKGPCVPWRGAGGKLGRCIYCGKIDPITDYYSDRATGAHANRAR